MVPIDVLFVLVLSAIILISVLIFLQNQELMEESSIVQPTLQNGLPLLSANVNTSSHPKEIAGLPSKPIVEVEDEVLYVDPLSGRKLRTSEVTHWPDEYKEEDLYLSEREKQLKIQVEGLLIRNDFEAVAQILSEESLDESFRDYLIAKNLLFAGDYGQAMSIVNTLDKRYPNGYLDVKSALFTLNAERRGELLKGTYVGYLLIQHMSNAQQQAAMTKNMLKRQPDFALAWEILANLLLDTDAKLTAIGRGLDCDCDIETHSKLKIQEAVIKLDQGDDKEGLKVLSNLILDPYVTEPIQQRAKVQLKKYLLA